MDYVGTDVYDNFWGKPFTPPAAWIHQLTEQWGLDWLAAFAAEHNKPIAIPEWSDEYRTDGHGLGDDPSFIDNMADWFVSNNVAFADVSSYDSSPTYRNNLLDGTFPKALARFKRPTSADTWSRSRPPRGDPSSRGGGTTWSAGTVRPVACEHEHSDAI